MPKSYYDEDGRLCSEFEMQNAIERAKQGNNFGLYFQLRQDYENIKNRNIIVSEDTIRGFFGHSNLFSNAKSAREVETIYNVVADRLKKNKDSSYEINVKTTVRDILAHPHATEELKIRMLKSLPVEAKTVLLKTSKNRTVTFESSIIPSAYTSYLLDNKIDERHLYSVLDSWNYTFEQKYQAAQKHDNGLAMLALFEPDLFFSEPSLVEELEANFFNAEKNGLKLDTYVNVFVKSRKPEHQKWAAQHLDEVEKAELYVRALTYNKYLSFEAARMVIAYLLRSNHGAIVGTSQSLIETFANDHYHKHRTSNVAQQMRYALTNNTPLRANHEYEEDEIHKRLISYETKTDLTTDEKQKLNALRGLRNAYEPYYSNLVKDYKKAVKEAKRQKIVPNKDATVTHFYQAMCDANYAIKGLRVYQVLKKAAR